MNGIHRWYCNSERWSTTVRDSLMPWVLGDVDLGDDVLEIGPGPGLTTDYLRARVPHLTSVEIDEGLAMRLRARLRATNVTVVNGDATMMPSQDRRFTGAVCCTMLHHVSTATLQHRLLTEVRRVLQPGAALVGSDSLPSLLFRVAHVADAMLLVDPATFADRLQAAGFEAAAVKLAPGAFRFEARRPLQASTS